MKTILHKTRAWAALALGCCLALALALPTFAADNPLVNDQAGLLSQSEVAALQQKAEEYSATFAQDIVIYTTDSIGGKDITAATDDYFDENGFGQGSDYSGVIVLLDMEGREFCITTSGQTIQNLSDYGIEHIEDEMVSALSDGAYADAFDLYLETVYDLLDQAANGTVYDVGTVSTGQDRMQRLGMALLTGLAVAVVFCLVCVNQLKTAVRQHSASDYVTGQGLSLTNRRDAYLYSHTTRRRKPEPSKSGGSSTHVGSSGRSHGGGGGRGF